MGMRSWTRKALLRFESTLCLRVLFEGSFKGSFKGSVWFMVQGFEFRALFRIPIGAFEGPESPLVMNQGLFLGLGWAS